MASLSPKSAIARAAGHPCLCGVDMWLSWCQYLHFFPAVGTGELASRVPPALSILGPTPAGAYGIAAALDNTPGQAGKWQGCSSASGRASLQGPWAVFHLGCLLLVALVTITCRQWRRGAADVCDVMWESCAAAAAWWGGGPGMCQGPASSLCRSPQGWLPTSSWPERTIHMCPCWRVVWLPTGSSGCLHD